MAARTQGAGLSDLTTAVAQAFDLEGALAAGSAHFQPREGQTQMALAIAEVVEQGGELVVEAGTGVGKTYA